MFRSHQVFIGHGDRDIHGNRHDDAARDRHGHWKGDSHGNRNPHVVGGGSAGTSGEMGMRSSRRRHSTPQADPERFRRSQE
jgi:hypothetical protein